MAAALSLRAFMQQIAVIEGHCDGERMIGTRAVLVRLQNLCVRHRSKDRFQLLFPQHPLCVSACPSSSFPTQHPNHDCPLVQGSSDGQRPAVPGAGHPSVRGVDARRTDAAAVDAPLAAARGKGCRAPPKPGRPGFGDRRCRRLRQSVPGVGAWLGGL